MQILKKVAHWISSWWNSANVRI